MNYYQVGDVVSYIRQNPDGTRDQVYIEAVSSHNQTCRGCYLYNRETMSVKIPICDKCYNTLVYAGENIKFDFSHIKHQ